MKGPQGKHHEGVWGLGQTSGCTLALSPSCCQCVVGSPEDRPDPNPVTFGVKAVGGASCLSPEGMRLGEKLPLAQGLWAPCLGGQGQARGGGPVGTRSRARAQDMSPEVGGGQPGRAAPTVLSGGS